jgi:arginine/lysine/ornithine decarboxylase
MTATTTPPGILPAPAARYDAAHGAVPLVEAIIRYRSVVTGALHVPGHAGGGEPAAGNLRTLLGGDMLASDVWLTTDALAEARRDAEARVAHAWGADRAYFLLDGSSGGNRAIHLAHPQPHPGGTHVVLARDSHISTMAGLVLSGATPHWVTPRLDQGGFGISIGVRPTDLGMTLAYATARGQQSTLVSVVSPGYAGACSDVAALATITHRHEAVLVVDEAWGAHLPFHPDLPPHALPLGADLAVVSAHKMLPALSGASIILVRNGRVDVDRLRRAVRMTQSTSPLLPVLASIDEARLVMVTTGTQLLDRALQLAADTRRRLAAIPGVRVADADSLGIPQHQFDPLRLVVDVSGLGLTGVHVEQLLRAPTPALGTGHLLHRAVAVEGADERNLFIVITPGTSPDVIETLLTAVRSLARRPRRSRQPGHDRHLVAALLAPREQACTPRDAHYAQIDVVPFQRALGRISAEPITPYPPGVPAVMPGERLDRDAIDALTAAVAQGIHIHGTADPTLTTLGVLRH